MSRFTQLAVVFSLAAGLAACGGTEDASKDTPSSEENRSQPTQTTGQTEVVVSKTSAKTVAKKEVTYRPINATLRDSGERIVIMVPEDADIDSGRMLEYRQDSDGTYYLKSIIPQ